MSAERQQRRVVQATKDPSGRDNEAGTVSIPADRVSKIFRVLKHNFVLMPLLWALIHVLLVAPTLNAYLRNSLVSAQAQYWSTQYWGVSSMVSFVLFILSQFTIIGISLMAMVPARPNRWAGGTKNFDLDRLLICVVSRGSNIQAIERAMASIKPVIDMDDRIKVHLLIEEHYSDSYRALQKQNVSITALPASYTPKKATHKARALEYFRQQQRLTKKDWVLHLDEETLIDGHVAQTCIDFIERRDREMQMAAQGIIIGFHPSDRRLRTLSVPAEYHGQSFGWVPRLFPLLNGHMENSITWETDSLVEDMWFGLEACSLGFECAWLPSFAREQSPFSVKDYLYQRRRCWPAWIYTGTYSGMPPLLFDLAVFDVIEFSSPSLP
ncbi:hypothetical protein BU23DRAFT_566608 [Bimuria novae-zelandiae CBS 107.79]|uniref:Glycosyltransferase 2-like domain-containing protein n=1 Tax=Bimuria novae-zelandiae CBS 107.79 TaxID=1447943 RepID=A0A6A5VE99_9PLEO|nr:hypothetical protein BU23DRAFT_566608 [Bimuria novae-zelandiae CBS 107.79]